VGGGERGGERESECNLLVIAFPKDEFGGHPEGAAYLGAFLFFALFKEGGDTKVSQFGHPFLVEKNVARFHIPMDHFAVV